MTTTLVLKIQNHSDLEELLRLVERLRIPYVKTKLARRQPLSEKQKLAREARVLAGLEIENPSKWIQDFEESRLDRPLPGRN